jgi:hypothetical protein
LGQTPAAGGIPADVSVPQQPREQQIPLQKQNVFDNDATA